MGIYETFKNYIPLIFTKKTLRGAQQLPRNEIIQIDLPLIPIQFHLQELPFGRASGADHKPIW